jgi:hypothetical protein
MRKAIMIGVALLIALVAFVACETEESRRVSQETQEDTILRAFAEYPIPELENFSTRATLSKWFERQDRINALHYTYIFADTGNVVGYFVTQQRPISGCSFMSPLDQVTEIAGSRWLVDAPALDVVYYGDGGACNSQIMFDSTTDALIETVGFKTITTDQPLLIEAEPITVEALVEAAGN